jgi:hypothetical protein
MLVVYLALLGNFGEIQSRELFYEDNNQGLRVTTVTEACGRGKSSGLVMS